MKKKIIYIIISIVTIIILFFGVKYLFITRIDIDDIKIEINSKYDFNSLKGKIRNKDIDLSNNSNIDYSKLGEYEVTLESHEKYAINTKKKVKVYVVDDKKPVITLKDNDIVIDYKEEYAEPGYTANDNYDGDITDKVIIENNIDNTKLGDYEVTYKVKDSSNNETILETTINVQKKNTKGIPVMMYHWFYDDTKGEDITKKPNNHNYISKTNFEKQIKYLVDNNYYFVTWDELNDYIDKKIDLPEKSIILTDDDGVKSFYEIAYPITLKYNVPITSFVITNKVVWKNYLNKDYLDMQSHTDSMHVRSCTKGKWDGKAMCESYKNIYNDLMTTKDKLKDNPTIFAYPFGHYSDDFIKALKDSGFKMAFTINSGRVKKGANKYKLPRVRVSRGTTLNQFASSIK